MDYNIFIVEDIADVNVLELRDISNLEGVTNPHLSEFIFWTFEGIERRTIICRSQFVISCSPPRGFKKVAKNDTLNMFPVQWIRIFLASPFFGYSSSLSELAQHEITWIHQFLHLEVGHHFCTNKFSLMKEFLMGFIYPKRGFQFDIFYTKRYANEGWWLSQHTQSIR